MTIFGKIIDLLSGGFGSKVVEAVGKLLPDNMSEKDRKEIEVKILEASREHEIALLSLANQADLEFNQRIKDLEGSAADLTKIPILGNIVIFLRGAQRPVWGFITIILDYMIFSGAWTLPEGSTLENCFFAINILVLGFLFGERAVKNVLPLFERLKK